MTCNNATDWSLRPTRALDDMTRRVNFRWESLQSFLLYLFTYEMPLDKVRALVGKVETDALAEFLPLRNAGERQAICLELLDRLSRIEDSTVKRAAEADLARSLGTLKDREQDASDLSDSEARSPKPEVQSPDLPPTPEGSSP